MMLLFLFPCICLFAASRAGYLLIYAVLREAGGFTDLMNI